MKLKRATYRHIEAEIFAYKDTLKAIEELRRDIILAGKQEELAVSGGGYVGSIVERRATRLADSILLKEMERITRAITDVYRDLPADRQRMMEFKYWGEGRNLRSPAIADALHIDESTLRRWRNGIVYAIAEKLGWY